MEHPPYMNIPEEEFLKEQNKYHKSYYYIYKKYYLCRR